MLCGPTGISRTMHGPSERRALVCGIKHVQPRSGIDEESGVGGLTEPCRLMQWRAGIEPRCCQISAGINQQLYGLGTWSSGYVGKQPIFLRFPGSSSVWMRREDGPRLVQMPIYDRHGKPIRLIQISPSAPSKQQL